MKKPTIATVAEQAGVAVSTVSRYLNGHYVSAPVQARLSEVIATLGYSRSWTARNLSLGRRGCIGVVVDHSADPWFVQLLTGIEEELANRDTGLMLASLVGAGSLPGLRAAMLVADGERPAPRLHPQVDVRAGAQLLQRAGFADPVADTRTLSVRFASLDRLVEDLRAQGLSNGLARPGPPLTRAQLAVARETFGERTLEPFEILTLSGWKR